MIFFPVWWTIKFSCSRIQLSHVCIHVPWQIWYRQNQSKVPHSNHKIKHKIVTKWFLFLLFLQPLIAKMALNLGYKTTFETFYIFRKFPLKLLCYSCKPKRTQKDNSMRFSLKFKGKGPASCFRELFRRQYKDTIQSREIAGHEWLLEANANIFLCAAVR